MGRPSVIFLPESLDFTEKMCYSLGVNIFERKVFPMEALLNSLITFATTKGLDLVGALLVIIIGFSISGKFCKLLRKVKSFSQIDPTAQTFIVGTLNVLLKAIVLLIAIDMMGVPMTNIVAIVGSCGLAIGLALQGSLSNFAGGVMIILFKPFKQGDFIESNGVTGTVQEVTILYTRLTTPDNKLIVIPNGSLSNAIVTNYSVSETRRLDVTIGVSYDSDLEKVKAALLEMAAANDKILTDPAPTSNVTGYGDSAINVGLRVWMKNADYWDVHFALHNALKAKFDEKSISIPFPQVDVHVINK